jgi:hypothetical protein
MGRRKDHVSISAYERERISDGDPGHCKGRMYIISARSASTVPFSHSFVINMIPARGQSVTPHAYLLLDVVTNPNLCKRSMHLDCTSSYPCIILNVSAFSCDCAVWPSTGD